MKRTFGFFLMLSILFVLGCSGNDKDRASAATGSGASLPSSAAGAEGSGVVPPEQPQMDAGASGGSSLPASTPYSQGKGGTVAQNVNAAPFLTSESIKGGAAQRAASSTGLVSRADGTMYGPSDQPAAGVGPGMQGAGQTSAGPGGNAGHNPGGGGLSSNAKPAANQRSGK